MPDQAVSLDAAASLRALSESLAHPAAQSLPAAASAFPFGRKIVLDDSKSGIDSFTVYADRAEVGMTDGSDLRVVFDWGAPKINAEPQNSGNDRIRNARICGEARWRDDNSVTVIIRCIGEPLTIALTVQPSGGGAKVCVNNTMRGAYELDGRFA